jgi:hypothetical protein
MKHTKIDEVKYDNVDVCIYIYIYIYIFISLEKGPSYEKRWIECLEI